MKLIVMDLDGTLVDSFEDIAASVNHALTSLGREPLPTHAVKRKVGHGLTNLLRALLPDSSEEEIQKAGTLVKAYYREHPVVFTKPYPGILEMLDALGEKGSVRVILSNKLDSLVKKIADEVGLTSRTEEVWGHREGIPLKPDPTSLHILLEKYKCRNEECLVLGDYLPDQQLARNGGTRFCAVTWGMTPKEDWKLAENEWLIESPSELLDTLHGKMPMVSTTTVPEEG